MEKHPEWTPVGTPPAARGMYLVDTERGPRVAAYMESLKLWLDRAENITDEVLAWTTLPPSYKKPKPVALEWHDGSENPDRIGTYLVQGKLADGMEFTACVHYNRGWLIKCTVIAWMPIPQVPTEILMRH